MSWRSRCAGLSLLAACIAVSGCMPKSDPGAEAARRLADREAIDATYQRYIQGLDGLDADRFADAFAPDGVLIVDTHSRQGREALRQVIAEEVALRQAARDRGETPRVLFHMESNLHVTFPAADRAERSAYWVTFVRVGKDPEGLSTLGVGTSVDELQRIDGEWLITRRDISLQPWKAP